MKNFCKSVLQVCFIVCAVCAAVIGCSNAADTGSPSAIPAISSGGGVAKTINTPGGTTKPNIGNGGGSAETPNNSGGTAGSGTVVSAITSVTVVKNSMFEQCKLKIDPENAYDKIQSIENDKKKLRNVGGKPSVNGDSYFIPPKDDNFYRERCIFLGHDSLKKGTILTFKGDGDTVLGSFKYDGNKSFEKVNQ